MKKLIQKLFGKKSAITYSDVDAVLIGEHINSICGTVTEIRNFKEKKSHPTPTSEITKKVDLDEAWPDSKELFIQMFGELNTIAKRFNLETGGFHTGATYTEALDAFIETLNKTKFGIADAVGTGRYKSRHLKGIGDSILATQQFANRLRKFVLVDFIYSNTPLRPAHETLHEDHLQNPNKSKPGQEYTEL